MIRPTRRSLLLGATGLSFSASGVGAYGMGIEPMQTPDVTRYRLTPPGWTPGLALRIAVIADLHACEPWMSAERIRGICLLANSLKPDLTVLLGDFNAGHDLVTGPVMPEDWGAAIAVLRAPLGVYGILGNHDVWHGALPRMAGDGGESVRRSLRAANVKLLENDAVRLDKDGRDFWILGLADQIAHRLSRSHFRGDDDLPGTLRKVEGDAPAILLAHEPYIFRRVPDRIGLTLCGHTHGGQIVLPVIGSPVARRMTPYVYGHFVEGGRHLIVSGGLGMSNLPVRLGRPPEILDIMVGEAETGPAVHV